MIQVYTGEGKGKTTAALGLILRTLGYGRKVALIQFMKKNYEYGEIRFLSAQKNVDIFQFGTDKLIDPNQPAQIDIEEAEKAYQKCKQVISSLKYDLIVIDEINVAVKWNLLSLEKQLELMEMETEAEIVITGRYAEKKVIEKADLVTEMREIKHYYKTGLQARKGVEY